MHLNTLNMAEGYVIVRSDRAGVFMGELAGRTAKEVTLRNSRRLWQWSGAASLSQLAVEGTRNPDGCRFPVAVPEQIVSGWIEIIPVTQVAKDSIDAVQIWSA